MLHFRIIILVEMALAIGLAIPGILAFARAPSNRNHRSFLFLCVSLSLCFFFDGLNRYLMAELIRLTDLYFRVSDIFLLAGGLGFTLRHHLSAPGRHGYGARQSPRRPSPKTIHATVTASGGDRACSGCAQFRALPCSGPTLSFRKRGLQCAPGAGLYCQPSVLTGVPVARGLRAGAFSRGQ